jgi:isopropylmalate/homocitrate/citramalate synthase
MKAATVGLAMPNSTEQIIREIAALLPAESRSAAY